MASLAPNIVQATGAASTTAAPSTFTMNWSQATTGGNCLVVYVIGAMSAGGGSFSIPAGFLTVFQNFQAGISIGCYVFPNCTNGLTTFVAGSMVNYNGIAIIGWEAANMLTGNGVIDPLAQGNDVRTVAGVSPGGALTAFPAITGNELWFGVLSYIVGGGTLTTANLPSTGVGQFTQTGPYTSTNGTTNITGYAFSANPGPVYPQGGIMRIAGSIQVAELSATGINAILSNCSSGLVSANIEGIQGGVGAYNGAVGG